MTPVTARKQSLEVWKFGGASLADGEALSRAAARIAAHDGPLVVVASALGGVTDLLLTAAGHAAAGRLDDARGVERRLSVSHEVDGAHARHSSMNTSVACMPRRLRRPRHPGRA